MAPSITAWLSSCLLLLITAASGLPWRLWRGSLPLLLALALLVGVDLGAAHFDAELAEERALKVLVARLERARGS